MALIINGRAAKLVNDSWVFVDTGEPVLSIIDGRLVELVGNEWIFSDTGEPVLEAACMDCHKPYKLFPLDITLPDEQWKMINPDVRGVLCANCIAERASKLDGVIAIRAKIDFG